MPTAKPSAVMVPLKVAVVPVSAPEKFPATPYTVGQRYDAVPRVVDAVALAE